MNEMQPLKIKILTGRSILTGVSGGDRCVEAVKELLLDHIPGEPVVLDFLEIEALGGSALRRLFQYIQALASCEGSAFVLVNLTDDALSEADLVAEAMHLPYIAAELVDDQFSRSVVRGQLDEKVAKTLRLVLHAGEADAQAVSQLANEVGVVTAWNNRLVFLHTLGLLRERKVGKRKLYSPVIGGLAYGS